MMSLKVVPQTNRVRSWGIVFFLFFAAMTTVWIYTPVLDMPFQDDDQIDYFAEMNGSRSLRHGLSLMDYSLKRQYAKGDEFLYRPLLFAWLAVEHRIFFYHHTYWNLATLALHLLVVILFFRLLWSICPGWPACFFSGWFLTSYNLSYLIMRGCHAAGYIWAIGFFIAGLHCLLNILHSAQPRRRDLVGYFFAATLGGFFLEVTMLVLVGMAGIGLLLKKRAQGGSLGKLGLLGVAPLGIYLAFYLPRLFMAERFFFVDSPGYHLFSTTRLAELPQWILVFFKIWFYKIKPPGVLWLVALEGGLAFLYLKCLSGEHLKKKAFFLAGVPAGILIYAFVLCFARQTPLFYHDYFFVMLGIAGLYALADWSRLKSKWKVAAAILGIIFLVQNALFAHSFVRTRFLVHEASRYFNQIIQFVDQHRLEKDFSFRIMNPPEALEGGHPMPVGYPDPENTKMVEKLWAEIIFAPYWKREGAKYELRWEEDSLQLSGSEGEQNSGL